LKGIKILGTGSYSPEMVLTNEDLSAYVDTSDEWITTRTGIKKRHIANGEPTWSMGTKASKKAIEMANIDIKDIDLIIVSSTTEDYYLPSTACMIQRELGISGCMALDLNCACSGFAYAIDMARRYFLADDMKYILVVSTEALSKVTDFTDRTTCVLFGDGAGACVLEKAEDTLYTSYLGADGNGAEFLCARHHEPARQLHGDPVKVQDGLPSEIKPYIIQNGKEVYKFATKILPMATRSACEKINLSVDEIDYFVPHQANIRIIETACKNLGATMDKFIVNIAEHGNTSSATIPIAFDEAVRSGKIKRGDKICFVGFGAGLTYGAVIFEY
jgi:3-oxoacyl-[acyl-carrier-protein] synthase-3